MFIFGALKIGVREKERPSWAMPRPDALLLCCVYVQRRENGAAVSYY